MPARSRRTSEKTRPAEPVAFSDRTGAFVFLPVGGGRYVRAHRSVLEAPCSICGVAVGALCLGAHGLPHGDTHVHRRKAAVKLRAAGAVKQGRLDDVIDPDELLQVRLEIAHTDVASLRAEVTGLAEALADRSRQLREAQDALVLACKTRDAAQTASSAAVLERQAMSLKLLMHERETAVLQATLLNSRQRDPAPRGAPHCPSCNGEPLYWRGSASDLATDIRGMLSAESIEDLCRSLGGLGQRRLEKFADKLVQNVDKVALGRLVAELRSESP